MKVFIALSTSILLVVGTLSMATSKETRPGVSSQINDNLFVLKASRKFKGAEIEVISSTGYLVTSKKLIKRKMIIDFKNVSKGNYRIRVRKGQDKEEFKFNKI